jgi:hypothetical protein
MSRDNEARSRDEVSAEEARFRDEFAEKEGELESEVHDLETIRETLESLDLAGTAEGAAEVEEPIEAAEEETVETFDRDDEALEAAQDEAAALEDDLQERTSDTESDADKVNDAAARVELDAPAAKLREAQEAAVRDAEFLNEHVKALEEARQESERVQAEYRQRAHSTGS